MTKKNQMQRSLAAMAVLLIIGLLASLVITGSSGSLQAPPATAYEPSGASYGAGANPTGDPVGGGAGYSHYYSSSGAAVVTSQSALTSALESATSGDVIWVPSGTTITISGAYAKTIKSGVILASNRGQNGAAGGKIKWTYTSGSGMTALFVCQSNSVVSGLTLEGPIATSSTSGSNGGSCIGLRGVNGASGIEVENCEISKFPWAGMYFNDGNLTESNRHYIHHCYIHNCQRHGYGYGISEEGSSYYLAEANLFRENRHHIMAQAASSNPNSYEVRYNEFYEAIYAANGNINGTWYYSHQVDCHGGSDYGGTYAGNILKIHHNTFYNNPGKPNVCIRGIPKTLCEVSWNWTLKSGSDSGQSPSSSQWSQYSAGSSYQKMSVHNNWYGTTPPSGTTTNAPAAPSAPTGVTSGVTAKAYTFQASAADPDGDQVTLSFTWGDGSTSTTGQVASGATASASHTWNQAGTYSVSVKATDSKGKSSSSSSGTTVTITGTSTQANTAPAKPSTPSGVTSGGTSTAYQFQASTTDPDGDQVAYTFYWSDGSTTTTGLVDSGATATSTHAWSSAGTYNVYVRAADSEGNKSSWSGALSVTITTSSQTNKPPVTPPKPSGTTSGSTSKYYMYKATTTDPNGDKISYTFYWSDGTTSTTSLMASGSTGYVSHKWSQAGTYGVYVRATDAKGSNSSWSARLTVTIASASLQTSAALGAAPETPSTPEGAITAEAASLYEYSAATSDPDGSPLEYVFYWGDGETSSVPNMAAGAIATAAHAWNEPGTYTITVSAMDPEGAVSELSGGLTVTVFTPLQPDIPGGAELPDPEPVAPDEQTPVQETVDPDVAAPFSNASDDTVDPPPAVTEDASSNETAEAGAQDEEAPVPAEDPGAAPSRWPIPVLVVAAGAAVVMTVAIVQHRRNRRLPD